jgi:hypothetical protein
VLRSKFFSSEQVEAIVRDYRNAGLEPSEVALMAFAGKVLNSSYNIDQTDINNLHDHGFTEEDIINIALTATSRSFFSRMVDTIGFQPSSAWLGKVQELLGTETFKSLNVGRVYNQEDMHNKI